MIIECDNGTVSDNSLALITNYYRTLDVNEKLTYEYELIVEKDSILCYFPESSLSRVKN